MKVKHLTIAFFSLLLAGLAACQQDDRYLNEANSFLQEGLEQRAAKQSDAAAECFSQGLLVLNRLKADTPAVQRLSAQLKDNLGAMYWKNNLNEEALTLHLEAVSVFEAMGDSALWAKSLRNAGRVSASLLQIKDADNYYHHALEIGKLLNDGEFVNETYLEMGHDLYLTSGDYAKAIAIANEAMEHGSDSSFCNLIIGLSNYYLDIDSLAMPYFGEASKSGKASIRMAAYQGMYLICDAQGDYQKALEYHELYNESMMQSDHEYKTKEVMRIKADYDMRMQQYNLQSEQKIKNLRIYLVIVVLGIALVVALLLLRQKTLKVKLHAEKSKNQLEIALKKNKVYLTALALSEQITASTLDFNIQEQEWDDYMELVDLIYTDFTKILQERYPSLNKNDLLICCLAKQGFSNQVISILLNLQTASYARRKSRIKQEKMNGLQDERSFEEIIDSL